MTIRTIIIIIIITAIIGTIAFITLDKESSIEKVILTDNYNKGKSAEEIKGKISSEFNKASDIYAVLLLKNIEIDDSIDICWKRIEKNQEVIIQKDTIIEKQKGSGPLVVSMIKKNDSHEIGDYKIYIKLNDSPAIEKSFIIK